MNTDFFLDTCLEYFLCVIFPRLGVVLILFIYCGRWLTVSYG